MLTYQAIKQKSKEDILSHALIGLEFEFYSNKSTEETRSAIAELSGKKIRLEDKAHSDFKPTDKEFKIEPDMSGGKGLMELVTGPLPYRESRALLINMLKWIEENGYTTDKSSIHINISFDPKLTGKNGLISKMDPLKFVLDFSSIVFNNVKIAEESNPPLNDVPTLTSLFSLNFVDLYNNE